MDVRRQQQGADGTAESLLSAPFFAAFIDGALIEDVGEAPASATHRRRPPTGGHFVGDDRPAGRDGPFAAPRSAAPRM